MYRPFLHTFLTYFHLDRSGEQFFLLHRFNQTFLWNVFYFLQTLLNILSRCLGIVWLRVTQISTAFFLLHNFYSFDQNFEFIMIRTYWFFLFFKSLVSIVERMFIFSEWIILVNRLRVIWIAIAPPQTTEIRRSLLDSERSIGWTDIDLQLALQDMFEPVDFHLTEEVKTTLNII